MAEDQTTKADDGCDYLFTHENRHWHERIAYFTLEMFRLYLTFSPQIHEDAITFCVEMIWNTKRDPYPSTKQLDAVMRNQLINPGVRATICRLYKKSFPWVSSSSSMPRSLMHLSRCSIKRHLKDSDYVDELLLPDKLKKYLQYREY